MRALRWLFVVLPAFVLAGAAAAANTTAEQMMGRSADAVDQFQGLLTTAAMVGPVGINPFLGLGGLGIAGWTGAWTPPATVGFIAHPGFWISALVLGAVIKFGRSFKLTKPIAEALGTGESVVGVAVVAVAGLAILQESGVVRVEQSSVILASLLFTIVASTATLLVIVRTAFDILVWLSPFPFVDLLFQALKAAATAVLLLMAVFAPGAAVVLNLLLIIAAALVVRWAVRTTVFGVTIAADLAFGWLRDRLELPRSPSGDLGPFVAFTVEVEGAPKRQRGHLTVTGGEWQLTTGKSLPLGRTVELSCGLMGVTVASANGSVLLPPRYKHLVDELARATGATIVDGAGAAPLPANATH
jgi:hypothetical protein